jgi:hypothetical protein
MITVTIIFATILIKKAIAYFASLAGRITDFI